MRLRWTDLAKRQAAAIRSDALLARLRRRLRLLRRLPESGRIVPEYQTPNRREIIVGVFRVGYVLLPDEIIVVTIVDGRQEFRWPDAVSESLVSYGY